MCCGSPPPVAASLSGTWIGPRTSGVALPVGSPRFQGPHRNVMPAPRPFERCRADPPDRRLVRPGKSFPGAFGG